MSPGLEPSWADERAVDLHRRHRQVAQRGVAGPEVVEHEHDAHPAQVVEVAARGLGRAQQDGLLAPRAAAAAAGSPLERRQSATSAGRSGCASWRRERLTSTTGPSARDAERGGALVAGLHQRPGADLHDQRGLLGDRDEVRRRRHHAARRVPAQQRLVADDAAVVEPHDRLERRAAAGPATAPAPARPPSAGARARAGAGACRTPRPARGPRPSRGRRRRRRRPAARPGRGAPRRPARSRSRRRQPVLDALDVHRLVDRLGQAVAERDRGRLVDVLADDDELVPAEPRHRVRGTDGRDQPARERDQQRVAGGVAVEVVDALEVVQVDEQDARRAVVAAACARARGSAARGTARGSPARSAGRAAPRGASARRCASAPSRSPARWRRRAGSSPGPR